MNKLLSIMLVFAMIAGICVLTGAMVSAQAMSGASLLLPKYGLEKAAPALIPVLPVKSPRGEFPWIASLSVAFAGLLGSFIIQSFQREGGVRQSLPMNPEARKSNSNKRLSKKMPVIRIRGHSGFRRPPAVLNDS